MNPYRTHNCGELNSSNVGGTVTLSGWVYRKRDHGKVIFVDLRDHYGVTQLVFTEQSPAFSIMADLRIESVVTVSGTVVSRSQEAINSLVATGEIEVIVEHLTVESEADVLPLNIAGEQDYPEETRLQYRFLDLRREKIKSNIVLRSKVIAELRKEMSELGFLEIQTPILTASSPEGARDYLVPSRLQPKKFYALPQAPQQFKQLLMVSGFDKYFQIAPCFRDEDARADRSPGEFYQLDVEMSFVTQDEIFAVMESVLFNVFSKFANKAVDREFPRITYHDAMLKYGSDKPDLRNPIEIVDVTDIFRDSEFKVFCNNVASGMVVRAIPAPGTANKPRSFFDQKIEEAKSFGAQGLGYVTFDAQDCSAKGPIAKFLDQEKLQKICDAANLQPGDSVFFASAKGDAAAKIAGEVRKILGNDLNLIDHNVFKFCWIVDFPYYYYDEKEQKIDFFHNPFSMPKGGMKALENQDPLSIEALQYDVVCNGVELSSGAIRNHKLEVMYKAFSLAGYSQQEVDDKFSAMVKAFRFGAPPHGGIAPGVDRMVMLLADEPNIREVICFPLNQKGEDLMMGAPSEVSKQHLSELHISPEGA